MTESLFETLREALRGRLLREEPLSRHTTWRIGGPAEIFAVPADRRDLAVALRILKEAGRPWMAIGAGSNLLVRDGGFRGVVLYTGALRRLTFEEGGRVHAGGGVPLMALIREAARRGWGGLEALAGIPGTVGGGVAMNAGAGGQELSGVVRTVVLTGPDGEETLNAGMLRFGYRRAEVPPDRVVAEATLQFAPANPAELEAQIRRRLAHRRQAHPVGAPNAGSVFKNPPGGAAWKLIEDAGMRGASEGGAQVSTRHANFIVNAGGATAKDVLTLIERTLAAVRAKSGIDLEPEVRIVGHG